MSNKKSPRSKKTDGGNVPNFVFNLSGSQPGSPLASPGGFGAGSTPSSPAQPSFSLGANTSPAFTFGDPASRTATNTTFNFNTSTTNSGSFNIKRGQSELDLSGPERNTIRRATSDLTFNATPASTQAFTFGANTNNTAGLTSQLSFGSVGSQTSSTSFSAPAATTPTSTTNRITFGTPATTASVGSNPTTTNTPATTSSTGFGIFNPTTTSTTTSTSTTASTPAISFGTPATTTSKPMSTFTFETPASTTSSTTTTAGSSNATPAFTFGTSTSSTSSTKASTSFNATPSFTFGTPASTTTSTTTATSSSTTTTKPTTASTFTGFGSLPSVVTPAPTSTGLSLGKPAESTNPVTSMTEFSIPAKTTTTTTTPATSTNTTTASDKPATTTPSFTFDSPKTTASASTLSFGSSIKPTSTTSTTTASTPATTSSLFSLSTSTTNKDVKKDSIVTSAPFSLGTTSGSTLHAVDPNKPNPFSFEKILEELAKAQAQPPNQMYASLVTPALSILQPNVIVSHTSFRIDNILPSTRFSELPEQAQKELDELEKYVRLEAQRCEYIGNQTGPKHLEAMEKSKKKTEDLAQQLDALTCTLKAKKESIESLYENVKSQVRHASDGCAVIEACKHPGDNARWLFGHSDDNDYFSMLAKQLEKRLEEYKKCIWEIERTAESWTHNRQQSPQDIADIMRAQNQAFLSLSNKVAALHESVNAEKNHYSQYLRMRS